VGEGRIEGIFIAAELHELPHPVERAQALAGKGLEGNRYFYADGEAPAGKAITLISAEAIEALEAEHGISLEPAASRRNVLTRGVDVNGLVGKRFKVGEIECYGVELCEPCSHLESMTKPGIIKGLVHRAGLNADILVDGEIAVGDAVAAADD
jgi:MOSC domain-containing protein YiiM